MRKAFNFALPVAYNAERKKRFHWAAKGRLHALALELNLPHGSYDIRRNEGGIAVSGEITLHSDKVYVQVAQSAFGSKDHGILVRTCNGRKDYTGGRNHWTRLALLNDVSALARYVQNVVCDSVWMQTPAEYRTIIDSKRYILEMDKASGATCLVPLETSDKAKLG